MDPIDENLFAIAVFILCYMIIKTKASSDKDWLRSRPQRITYCFFTTITQLILQNFPPNIHLYLFEFTCIKSADPDSEWLMFIKVLQTLTGNTNSFC